MSFDWQTDEDKHWQEEAKPEAAAVASFWRRRWPFFVMVLLGVATVWGAVQWQINQRVTNATEDISTDILNTHNFVRQTAVNQDADLFKANLSGLDPAWVDVQKEMLDADLLLGRPMLGWQYEGESSDLTLDDVILELSPDLRAAELIYPQTYAVKTAAGTVETVTLQQTAVYRQGNSRWLYAPPLEAFWGDWISQGETHLTLVYPERDKEVAARLALDLDALLGQMCTEFNDLHCEADFRMHLRLDTDPGSLLDSHNSETLLRANSRLELPTPTLVGLPQDEAGYEALYQAYGVQLATAVLVQQSGYECCHRALFFWALRDYQLAQLGLQAWPLANVGLAPTLWTKFDGDALNQWARRWQQPPAQFTQLEEGAEATLAWQRVYLLIEYLAAQETAVSATEMMNLLVRNSYYGWLADVLSGEYDELFFTTHFLDYVYQQTAAAEQAAPPIPLPQGKVTLICSDFSGGARAENMYEYDLGHQSWAALFLDLDLEGYVSSSDGENFLVTEFDFNRFDQSVSNHYWLRDGELQLLEQFTPRQNEEHSVNYFFLDEAPEYIMRYESYEGEWRVDMRSLDCPTVGCAEKELVGIPVISPDSRYVLERIFPTVTTGPQEELQYDLLLSPLSLDEEMRQPLGKGGQPFWLDNNAYGFVRLNEAGWELVTAVLSQNQPRVILQKAEVLARLPEGLQPVGTVSVQVGVNPQIPRQLLLTLRSPQPKTYFFDLRLNADFTSVERMELLYTSDDHSSYASFSPDGRYIIVSSYNPNNGRNAISLLDQESGAYKQPIEVEWFNFSWSSDGQWLILRGENNVHFYAPAYDYHYYVPFGLENCQQLFLSDE